MPEGERGVPGMGASALGPQHPSFLLLLPLAGVGTSSCLVCSPLTFRVSGPLQSSLFQAQGVSDFSGLGPVLWPL